MRTWYEYHGEHMSRVPTLQRGGLAADYPLTGEASTVVRWVGSTVVVVV